MDGTVRLWDANQRKERHLLRHPAGVRSLSFSHDSRFLATAAHGSPGKHGAIRVWEVAGGKEGIRGTVVGGFTAGFRAEAPGGATVMVLENDLPRAKEILAELRKHGADIDWSKVDVDEPEGR